MKLLSLGTLGLFVSLSQQGRAGIIQDPARVRLVGHCGKLEATAISFDEQGRLRIDLSGLPPLTPEHKKWLCQIKVPFITDAKALEGSWHLDSFYKAGQGSRMVSTVRFSGPGEVSPAKVWEVTDAVNKDTAWDETWSVPSESKDEQELKITWTSEMEMPKDGEPPLGCPPSFTLKQLIIAPPTPPTPQSPVE